MPVYSTAWSEDKNAVTSSKVVYVFLRGGCYHCMRLCGSVHCHSHYPHSHYRAYLSNPQWVVKPQNETESREKDGNKKPAEDVPPPPRPKVWT